jgi:hypothetical protein
MNKRRLRGKRRNKKEPTTGTTIFDLPNDILVDILVKLPLRELWYIGSVNTLFRNLTRLTNANTESRIYERTWKTAFGRTGLVRNFDEWLEWWNESNGGLENRHTLRAVIIKLETLDILGKMFKNTTIELGLEYFNLPVDIQMPHAQAFIDGPARSVVDLTVEYTPTLTQKEGTYWTTWTWDDSIYSFKQPSLAAYLLETKADSALWNEEIRSELVGEYFDGEQLAPILMDELGMPSDQFVEIITDPDARLYIRIDQPVELARKHVITLENVLQLVRLPKQAISDHCCPYSIVVKELGGNDKENQRYVAHYLSIRVALAKFNLPEPVCGHSCVATFIKTLDDLPEHERKKALRTDTFGSLH